MGLIELKYEPDVIYYEQDGGNHQYKSSEPFRSYAIHEGFIWLKCHDHEQYIGPCTHIVVPLSDEYAEEIQRAWDDGTWP